MRLSRAVPIWIALAALGCSGGSGGGSQPDGAVDAAPDSSADVDTDADAGSDTDADSDSGSDAGTDAGAMCPPLSAYSLTQDVILDEIPAEGSGLAWDRDTGTFFVVANYQGKIWEYDATLSTLLRTISLSGMDADTEGLEVLEDGWLAIATEANLVYVVQIGGGETAVSGADGAAQIFQPLGQPPVVNAGLEGIAFHRAEGDAPGRIFVCQEHLPMRVLQFDWIPGSPPFETQSYADGTLDVDEPWDAQVALSGCVDDIAGMAYDESSDTLLIVSQMSSRVIRVDPGTGAVLEQMELPDTTTSEGITLFDTCKIAVVSEPNRVQVFEP